MFLLLPLLPDLILRFRRLLVDVVDAKNTLPGYPILKLAYPWLNAKCRWLLKRLAKPVAI
jgi:hypothetical protein